MDPDIMADENERDTSQEEIVDMQFDDNSGTTGSGGDAMLGMSTALNIVDITEVFTPPRVLIQGEKLGLCAGSSMDLLTGWNSRSRQIGTER